MTPKATTPAGRGTRNQADGSSAAGAGHRRTLRPKPAPRTPRRVSGPAGGRPVAAAATAAAGGTTGLGRGAGVALPGQRRATRGRTRRPQATRSRTALPLGLRARSFVRGLPDHRLLDRAVRGRAWIPILGVMLAGIVAMQVEVLKLGANIGRSIERGTALQSRNELLRASVASLADDQRIERIAAGMGMVMPAPTGVGFLDVRRGDVRRALAGIHAPDPTTFLNALLASQATANRPSAPATSTTGVSAGVTATSTPTATATATQAPATQTPATQTPATQTPATSTAATQTPAQPTVPVGTAPTSTTGGASATGG